MQYLTDTELAQVRETIEWAETQRGNNSPLGLEIILHDTNGEFAGRVTIIDGLYRFTMQEQDDD